MEYGYARKEDMEEDSTPEKKVKGMGDDIPFVT